MTNDSTIVLFNMFHKQNSHFWNSSTFDKCFFLDSEIFALRQLMRAWHHILSYSPSPCSIDAFSTSDFNSLILLMLWNILKQPKQRFTLQGSQRMILLRCFVQSEPEAHRWRLQMASFAVEWMGQWESLLSQIFNVPWVGLSILLFTLVAFLSKTLQCCCLCPHSFSFSLLSCFSWMTPLIEDSDQEQSMSRQSSSGTQSGSLIFLSLFSTELHGQFCIRHAFMTRTCTPRAR